MTALPKPPATRIALALYRFILVGVVTVLLILAIRSVLGTHLTHSEILVAGLVSGALLLRTAFAFGRGDYLRRAYLLQGLTYLWVGVVTLVPAGETTTGKLTADALTLIMNVVAAVATWHFSRAFAAAGLEIPGSRWSKRLLVVGLAAVVLFVAGPPALRAFHAVVAGDLGLVPNVISFLGDLAVLLLLGPMFLTAVALRGGALVWPWALFTAASVLWIIIDSLDLIGTLFASSPGAANGLDVLPILACVLSGAAALIQHALIRRTAVEDSGPPTS